MPEVAVDGTRQDAETSQFPQSMSPVLVSDRQAGWICGREADGWTVATRRAPRPP